MYIYKHFFIKDKYDILKIKVNKRLINRQIIYLILY